MSSWAPARPLTGWGLPQVPCLWVTTITWPPEGPSPAAAQLPSDGQEITPTPADGTGKALPQVPCTSLIRPPPTAAVQSPGAGQEMALGVPRTLRALPQVPFVSEITNAPCWPDAK